MDNLPFILQVIALVCLFFATFNMFLSPRPYGPVWGWAGMLLWLLSLMIAGGIHLHPTTGLGH